MKLSLHSVGGFTGPAGARTCTVDLDQLPAADAGHLRALVQSLDPAQLPPTLLKNRPQSWDFLYTLTIDGDDGACRQLRFHADSAPPALRELTDLLDAYPPS